MELKLKTTLKTLKINEPTISAVLGAIVLVSIAILLINFFKKDTNLISSTASQTQNIQEQQALPSTYKVQKGDHLWKISETYFKSGYNWVDIAKANNLKNPSILVEGQELTIPQVEAKQITVLAESAQPQAPPSGQGLAKPDGQITTAAAQIEAITGNTYTVQKGDSLWKISVRAYSDGYQWPKLAQENKLKNPNHIVPAQTISIPR